MDHDVDTWLKNIMCTKSVLVILLDGVDINRIEVVDMTGLDGEVAELGVA